MKKNFIGSSIAAKVQIAVQSVFLVVSILQTAYTYNNESEAREKAQEAQVDTIADGVINGANMLMVTGAISDVDQRKLFIQKVLINK